MDYKEKYEMALEGIQEILSSGEDSIKMSRLQLRLQGIFPELKESEDEKIRKELIDFVKSRLAGFPQYEKFIAWIEKQGEQKPFDYENANIQQKDFASIEPKFKVGDTMRTLQEAADGYTDGMPVVLSVDKEYYHCTNELIAIKDQDDYEFPPINVKLKYFTPKVELKFHEGDWVVFNNRHQSIYQVEKIEDGYYILRHTHGGTFRVCVLHDESLRLWAIRDAKNADVLVCRGNIKNSSGIKYERICLFNSLDKAFFTLTRTSNGIEEYDIDVNIDYPDNTVPATKEQKEILFMAMADAGYTFDFDKKELKKIEQIPAWSEDDEMIALSIEQVMNCASLLNIVPEKIDKIRTWLKSLKDRCTWKPSDEQMDTLKEATNIAGGKYKSCLNSLYQDLKKLK